MTRDMSVWQLAKQYVDKAITALTTYVNTGTRVVFTPEQYGAVGNGSTDDTTAVQSALTAANASKNGYVFFSKTYKVTSSLSCTGFKDVELVGTTRGRTSGSGLVWAGSNSGVVIKADNAEGLVIKGLSFSATSSSFAGYHIDFSNSSAAPQAFHILIEWCFFTGGGSNLHTDIRCGGGHNYCIRLNNFYKSDIAILGREVSFTPAQAVQTALIERNWFEAGRGTAHIVNPHTNWKISNNAVECLSNGDAGFIKLVGSGAVLKSVTIEDNWCGDTTVAGTQIEMAGGPFRITGNMLDAGATGYSMKAVAVIERGCCIEDNRYNGNASGTFIDWGAFTHVPVSGSPSMGGYRVLGNDVAGNTALFAGTKPPSLITDIVGEFSYVPPAMKVIDAATVSGAVSVDPALNRRAVFIYLSANVTSFSIGTATHSGQQLTILLRQDGGGVRTFVWPGSFHFPGGTGPACAGAFNQTTLTVMWDSSSSRWVEVSRSVNIT